MTTEEIEYYGGREVSIGRIDIRETQSMSVDLRAETGAGVVPDESGLVPAGVFSLSVFEPVSAEWPVGEIRIWFAGREIRIVGHLTGRPGMVEVTPDHLSASIKDATYRKQILSWLGVAA